MNEAVYSADRYRWLTWRGGEFSIKTPKGLLTLNRGDSFGVRPASSKKGMFRIVKSDEPMSKVYSVNQYDYDRIMSMNESYKMFGNKFMEGIGNWNHNCIKEFDGSKVIILEKSNDFGLDRINLKKYLKEQYGNKVKFYKVSGLFDNSERIGVGINEALVQTDQTKSDLELPADINLLSMFRGALADEQSATTLYDRIIEVTKKLPIDEQKKKIIIDIITEIRNDEKNHTGKLLFLIKLLDEAFNYITKGMENEEVSENESDSESDETEEETSEESVETEDLDK